MRCLERLKQLRWRFSILSLMILLAICAIPAAWIAQQRSLYIYQRCTVNEILSRTPEGSNCIVEIEPANPKWMNLFVSDDTFFRVSSLSFIYICDKDIEAAAHLQYVDDLNFFMSSVTDRDLTPFRQVHMQVGTLGLAYTQVTDDGVECFAGVRGLHSIDLRCCGAVTGRCLEVFQKAPIVDLDLSGSGFSAENFRWVTCFPQLRRLSLNGCKFAGHDISHISDLKEIQELELSDTNLDDQGMRTLGNHRKLKRLTLSGTKITGAGLGYLQPLQDLETLHVCGTAIVDDDLKALLCLSSLHNLRMVNTQVTDNGLRYLCQMKALRIVWIDPSSVTADGVSRLRKQCSQLRVFYTRERDGWP